MKFISSRLLALALPGTLALVGCATQPMGPTVLVMPAPTKRFEVFPHDRAMCLQYAQSMVGG
ncbi:MAG: glycine zipper family protein, partial [Proteobacteria bacterium]|nr:glycine zipper family protein [Pseudomonadota bacterium]